jgi:hypothetical protein
VIAPSCARPSAMASKRPMVSSVRRVLPVALLVALTAPATAANPPLVGANEVARFAPTNGFVDDAIAADGERLAYVVTDAAARAELHVVTLATKQEQVIDLAPITLHPVALELVGARVFVVGAGEDNKRVAALVDLSDKAKTKVIYKLPAASDITLVAQGTKLRVAVHRATPSKTGTRHEVELLALETGARIGSVHVLELDTANTNKALDFRVNHWGLGFTRAYGIKGGEWDRKEDQRSPDVEATYDLLTSKLVDRSPITDLFEQRRRFQTLADAGNRVDFIRPAPDNASLQLWRAGKPRPIELDQPFTSYDPKSIQAIVLPDGSAWLALKVDPVNADAVARKKADAEYLDIFRITADGKASRKSRVLAANLRHRFGIAGNRFWLLERNQGFERGGKSVALYDVQ